MKHTSFNMCISITLTDTQIGILVSIVYSPHNLYWVEKDSYENNKQLDKILSQEEGVFVSNFNMSDMNQDLETARETTSRNLLEKIQEGGCHSP